MDHPAIASNTKVVDAFRRRFGSGGEVRVARAPGRVNLIGEHTDYNEGYVLPIAVDRSVRIAFRPRDDRRVELYSLDYDQQGGFSLDKLERAAEPAWLNYPMGVAWAMREEGFELHGLDGVVSGDVPIGAGLSSSAAFEVAAATALLQSPASVDRLRLALACQKAENEFVGMRCGLMDQYVSLFARAGHAVFLDCLKRTHEQVPLPDDVAVLVCDTGVKHALLESGYNARRAECEEARRRLSEVEPELQSLRNVRPEHIEKHWGLLGPTLAKRARHVVSECARVIHSVEALRRGDVARFGRLVDASHNSLRDDFEVSCRELDTMVELARAEAGTLGARMVGGGFGGCTVTLARPNRVESVRRAVAEGYRRAVGIEAVTYVFRPAQGACMEEIDERH